VTGLKTAPDDDASRLFYQLTDTTHHMYDTPTERTVPPSPQSTQLAWICVLLVHETLEQTLGRGDMAGSMRPPERTPKR
jgi:hypothetical protein